MLSVTFPGALFAPGGEGAPVMVSHPYDIQGPALGVRVRIIDPRRCMVCYHIEHKKLFLPFSVQGTRVKFDVAPGKVLTMYLHNSPPPTDDFDYICRLVFAEKWFVEDGKYAHVIKG